ncbi:MAG: hypothetical protein J6Y11_08795 [Paludibacteraceae bacterium]|nr:hypothetical protein [Paludibacteraceae bacterium]
MKDEVLGELDYNKYVWVKGLNKTLFGSDVQVRVLVQDENQEGILDVQREAYQTYLENEERYIKEVPQYLLDYYKWNYEEIDRVVYLEEDKQKDTIAENALFRMCKVFFLFICRDGSFGWILGSSWSKMAFAVLLSELEPRVLHTREELRFLHKLNDNTFDTLIHDGKKYWSTWDELPFYDELVNVRIEVEGSVDEGVNSKQQNAYTQYLSNKKEYLKKLSDFLLPIYLGDKKRAEEMIQTNQPVVVKTALPKRLVIDQNGNMGWICYTNWDDSYIGVLLSSDRIEIMTEYQLRNLSKSNIVEDDVCGKLFVDPMFGCKTEIVRLFGGIKTTNVAFRLVKGNLTNQQRASYEKYQNLDPKFWDGIKDEMLEYYLSLYEDLQDYMDIPESLEKDKVTRDSVMEIVHFKELYFSFDGMAGWLCESPTDEEDGIAFEFSDGKIKLIPQPEIL